MGASLKKGNCWWKDKLLYCWSLQNGKCSQHFTNTWVNLHWALNKRMDPINSTGVLSALTWNLFAGWYGVRFTKGSRIYSQYFTIAMPNINKNEETDTTRSSLFLLQFLMEKGCIPSRK